MALTSTIAYCENQAVFDIYPRIDSFDLKRRLPENWVQVGTKHTLYNSGVVDRLFMNGEDLGVPEEDLGQMVGNGDWLYTKSNNSVVIEQNLGTGGGGTDPNTVIMETGEVWGTAITRLSRKASRIIESTLGSTIAREIMKDREGNYSPSIVQATALKTAILFIMAHNPIHDDLEPLKGEYDDIMAKIKSGKIIMTGHRSTDDSKGILRAIVSGGVTQIDGVVQTIHPVLHGNYTGSDYELLYLYFQ